MFKNKKTTNLFDKRINEKKDAYEKLVKKELANLNETIKSEKYNVNAMISKTNLGHVYNDLINSKDNLNSQYQRKYNQAYHTVDRELYKINKRIDGKTKMINYKYNDKKEKVVDQVLRKVVG